ncbi:protein D3-like [Anopheles ziemanni]|uniref:protein D3-like n=1 Tax=Anopheles coustani TaxID=139045 RepID=UPI002657F1DC|nr:protein D3-like [Anopheles coustani]XP_058130177.1 protein D3-like [Anopheles coustani]XP_058171676.1 protein D3-like [Anopheles ziemanni]
MTIRYVMMVRVLPRASVLLWLCLVLDAARATFGDVTTTTTPSNMTDIQQVFTEHEVIPDVIDVAPKEFAKISYPSGVTVEGGNELRPTQVKDQPKVEWTTEPDAFYTLFMVDPDAPNRQEPKFREIGHWLVGNIPGTKVEDGDHMYGFVGSGPPNGSGLHRYVFLVYKQPTGRIDFSKAPRVSNRSRNHRLNYKHREFVKQYGLGELVAGNFYQAQYDDYVPTLHAQLSSGTE